MGGATLVGDPPPLTGRHVALMTTQTCRSRCGLLSCPLNSAFKLGIKCIHSTAACMAFVQQAMALAAQLETDQAQAQACRHAHRRAGQSLTEMH